MLNGIIFSVASVLMIALIVWVIWGVARDRKKGASYIDKSLPFLSAKDTPIVVAAQKTSPWKLITLGVVILLIAIVMKFFGAIDPLGRIEGMGLGGIVIIYLGFRSWRSAKKVTATDLPQPLQQ